MKYSGGSEEAASQFRGNNTQPAYLKERKNALQFSLTAGFENREVLDSYSLALSVFRKLVGHICTI